MGNAAERQALEALIQLARTDSATFADVYYGRPSKPFHREWHAAWNAANARVVLWSSIELGKTTQAAAWALHRIATQPTHERVLIISADQTGAKKIAGVVKRAIEDAVSPNPSPAGKRLKLIFPDLGRGEPWTDAYFNVANADARDKDFSLQAIGWGGNILGGRLTTVIADDIVTFGTTYTLDRRLSVARWFSSTILGRVLDGGRVIVLGNAWYHDDLMHELEHDGFNGMRYPLYATSDDGHLIPSTIIWPERFTPDRIGMTQNSYRADGQHRSAHGDDEAPCSGCLTPSMRMQHGTIESLRALQVTPYSSGGGRFRQEWFDRGERAGSHLKFLHEYHGEFGPAYGGVDIGVDRKEGNDASAFWIYVQRDDGRRQVIYAEEAKYTPPGLVARFAELHARYSPVWKVENNSAQEFFRQWAACQGIPSLPHTTGKNKADPKIGVPVLAVELEQGMWLLPSGDMTCRDAMRQWRTQCMDWSPARHPGNLLMSSWFAREAGRAGFGVEGTVEPGSGLARYNLHGNYSGSRTRLFGGR